MVSNVLKYFHHGMILLPKIMKTVSSVKKISYLHTLTHLSYLFYKMKLHILKVFSVL